jgi:hypothetical protein
VNNAGCVKSCFEKWLEYLFNTIFEYLNTYLMNFNSLFGLMSLLISLIFLSAGFSKPKSEDFNYFENKLLIGE